MWPNLFENMLVRIWKEQKTIFAEREQAAKQFTCSLPYVLEYRKDFKSFPLKDRKRISKIAKLGLRSQRRIDFSDYQMIVCFKSKTDRQPIAICSLEHMYIRHLCVHPDYHHLEIDLTMIRFICDQITRLKTQIIQYKQRGFRLLVTPGIRLKWRKSWILLSWSDKDLDTIYLSVRKSNQTAIDNYRKFGFEEIEHPFPEYSRLRFIQLGYKTKPTDIRY